MALLQISEPGQSQAPHRHRLAVGIDLGTTNSLVAAVRSGEAMVLADDEGVEILPSIVYYHEQGVLVGVEAKAKACVDAANTVVSVKRLMGRGIEDVRTLGGQLPYRFVGGDALGDKNQQQGMPYIDTVSGPVSPVAVSAEILSALKNRAEKSLAGELSGAVITVPAYFDEAQRQATKDAATVAGLNVLRLLSEPTAAAIAYGLDKGSEGLYAVYDLGGGTFDVSILRLQKGVFEVLAIGGDSALGGDDVDQAIAQWLMSKLDVSSLTMQQQRNILVYACELKEQLSSSESVDVEVSVADANWKGVLSSSEFSDVIASLVGKTLSACKRAVRDAGLKNEIVDGVVMVGGSTRIPQVREQVGEFFKAPVLVDLDPDKVVAIGAAIQADVLIGNNPDSEMLLLDVIPLSLGLEMMGGLVEKIVPRNTTIPVTRAQEFTTFKDGQTAMSVHVLQGERELVDDCRSLARFDLKGIPALVAGSARIRVTFQIDADGLLSVTAKELSTEVESFVEVKPSYGLSDQEIANMLKAGFDNAQGDANQRALKEVQVEADRVVEAVQAALIEDGDLLLSEERKIAINAAVENVKNHMSAVLADDLQLALENLNKVTEAYAAERMNYRIEQALTGHKVSSVDVNPIEDRNSCLK